MLPDSNSRDLDDLLAEMAARIKDQSGRVANLEGLENAMPGGGTLADHDHSGDAGDGGTFDAANLTSDGASDGDVLTADGSGGADWEAPSAGPTAAGTFYNVDAAPASPHASDDEFDDSSIGAAWTEFDPANVGTLSEGETGLVLQQTTQATPYTSGIYRTAPASNWSIITRMMVPYPGSAHSANELTAGIAVFQAAAGSPTTTDMRGMGVYYQNSGFVYFRAFSASDYTLALGALTGDLGHNAPNCPGGYYFRVRWISPTLYYDYSKDGWHWYQHTSGNPGWTPAEVGFVIRNKNTGATYNAYFQFFRVSTDTGLVTPLKGRRINYYA